MTLTDLKLAMEIAAGAGAKVPMGNRAAEIYEAYTAADNGSNDFSGIIKAL